METLVLTEKETGLRDVLQNKMDENLKNKGKDIQSVIEKVETDNHLLNDFLVPTKDLTFNHDGNLNLSFQDKSFEVTTFSIGQIADKYEIPRSYLKDLSTGPDWQKELAKEILNKTSINGDRQRVLLREVNGKIRGFLSDSYRRYDSMKIYISFLQAVQMQKAVLLDAFSDESKDFFEVVHPQIIPVKTELNGTVYMAFGARLRHSDYGDGALELRTFNIQAICLNGAVTESKIREIHLGKKLPEDIRLSEETYRLDSLTKASLVSDTIKDVFSLDNLNNDIARIQKAGSIRIDYEKEIKKLPKMGMQEGEIKILTNKLMANLEKDGLSGEPSLWKFAQGIGAVANEVPKDPKRELHEIAGLVMMN